MKDHRIFNFNPGPAALPLPVLEEIQENFLNFAGTGMSITEVSHRSPAFDEVINDAVARTRRLLDLDDRFKVLFMQGGASLQFALIPMNFLADGDSADYVNTGTWSTKAIKEAQVLGKSIRVAGSSEDREFAYVINKQRKFMGVVSTDSLESAMDRDENTLDAALLDNVEPVPAETPLQEILAVVRGYEFPVPVVDEDNVYLGVISKNAFLRTLEAGVPETGAGTTE